MSSYTSEVILIADVSDALSKLEDVESKLEKLESGDNKLKFGMDKSDAKSFQKDLNSVDKLINQESKSFDALFGAGSSQKFSDLTKQFNDAVSKMEFDPKAAFGDISSIAGQIQAYINPVLETALNKGWTGYTGKTNVTGTFLEGLKQEQAEIDKTASEMDDSGDKLQKSINKINDSMSEMGPQQKATKALANFKDFQKEYGDLAKENDQAAEAMEKGAQAVEKLQGIYNRLAEAQDENGNVSENSLLGVGFSEDEIKNLPSEIASRERAVKNSEDIVKTLTSNAKAIQDIESSFGKRQYQSQASGINKMLEGYSEINTDDLSKVRTSLSEFQQDLSDLQSVYNKDTGQFDLNKLFSMDRWQEGGMEKLLNLPNTLKDISTTASNATKELGNMGANDKLVDGINNYQTKIDDLKNSISKLSDSDTKTSLNGTAQDIQSKYDQLKVDVNNAATAEDWRKVAQDFAEIQKSASGAVAEVNNLQASSSGMTTLASNLSGSFNTAFTAVKNVIGTQMIYRQIRQVAKEMVSTVEEIDTAMNQLQIVTGASDTQMGTFFESSIDQAKELGQSVTDVLDTIQVYSRLGYNLEDASQLAEYTSILSNVAAVDVEDATTGLTSVIKGFDLDVSEAEHVSDVLIDIGQNYAVSASEILEAFTHSSAAFGATGTTFEEAAAIIAAGNAAVQDASTVGTALKTVSARIRKSTTELDELGESYDDLAEGFSKYRGELMSLTGFDIMEEGTIDDFKSIYDIFDGIAQTWSTLSETQQSRVSEILGGTRQLQVISSIINNWDDAASAYAEAMDSAGVSTDAQATYMESLQAKTDQFHASVQELYYDFLDSDLVSGVIDWGTDMIQIFDNIIDSVGSLSAAILALGAGGAIKSLV